MNLPTDSAEEPNLLYIDPFIAMTAGAGMFAEFSSDSTLRQPISRNGHCPIVALGELQGVLIEELEEISGQRIGCHGGPVKKVA